MLFLGRPRFFARVGFMQKLVGGPFKVSSSLSESFAGSKLGLGWRFGAGGPERVLSHSIRP
jgi:hypothetical protein